MCLLEQNGGVYVCRISKYNIRMNQEKQKAKKKVIPFLLGIQSKLNFSYHLVSTNSVEFLDVYVVYQNSYIFSL